jgi:hypothetical protein
VDLRAHHPILPFFRVREPAVRKEPADDVFVGIVYSRKLIDQVDHPGIELLQPVGAE